MSRLGENKTVGDWTCLRPLGGGGNADVWEVLHEDGRHGAIKVVRDQRPEKTAYARFVREIQTLRSLTPRDGVVGVLDDHLPDEPSAKDFAWLVMPLARPLEDALAKKSVADVVAAMAQVAETLAGLRDAGLAHRDIKPANLFWFEDRAAVGDFGLVELPDVETLNDGRVPGSFGFIADEVLADPLGSEGGPADVFALAKSLWVLLVDGQDFPPQGHIRADGGAATLSRRLVVGSVDDLDRIIDRATAPVQVRLTMRQLAGELRAWSTAPITREMPANFGEALQRARGAMQETFTERDAERERAEAWEEAYELVRRRSDELMQILTQVDPAAEVGPYANGFLHEYTEVSEYIGGPLVEHHGHWGGRVAKGNENFPTVLLVDFGVGIDTNSNVHVSAFAMAGFERASGGKHYGPHDIASPMRTLQLEHGIDELVGLVGQQMPGLLEAFAAFD
jgi:hypothetical protein